MSDATIHLAALATRRRRLHPTAIVLTTPTFFSSAVRVASKKKGRTLRGVLSSRTRLANAPKAARRGVVSQFEGRSKSFIC